MVLTDDETGKEGAGKEKEGTKNTLTETQQGKEESWNHLRCPSRCHLRAVDVHTRAPCRAVQKGKRQLSERRPALPASCDDCEVCYMPTQRNERRKTKGSPRCASEGG